MSTVITANVSSPDDFSFTAQIDTAPSTVITSNTVTLNGASTAVWPLLVQGDGSPQVQVNSDSWVNEAIARDGDTIKVRLTSSAEDSTMLTATLYMPGRTETFSVTTAAEASELLTDLISYWKLDEASGARVDSHGANNLSDNNTVAQTTGKIGNAALFLAASSETLSAASNSGLQTGDIDFTIAGWFYLDSTTASILAGKDGPAGREWFLYNNGSRFQFWYYNGSGFATATADPAGAPSSGTWYFIVAWHSAAANNVLIQVNNGTADGVASGGTGNTPGTDPVVLGGRGHADVYYSGRIDEFGFWKRLLTADEKTELYNAGAGKTYPFA